MQSAKTEGRQRWLEDRAKKMGYRAGVVSFQTCGICGSSEWASTRTKDHNGQEIECLEVQEYIDEFSNNCRLCAHVAQRSPEVFQWVISAIEWNNNKPDK